MSTNWSKLIVTRTTKTHLIHVIHAVKTIWRAACHAIEGSLYLFYIHIEAVSYNSSIIKFLLNFSTSHLVNLWSFCAKAGQKKNTEYQREISGNNRFYYKHAPKIPWTFFILKYLCCLSKLKLERISVFISTLLQTVLKQFFVCLFVFVFNSWSPLQ